MAINDKDRKRLSKIRDKENKEKIPSSINKMAKALQDNLDALYQKTYFSKIDNKRNLDSIKTNIDTAIDNIITNNMNNTGKPSISRLYTRLNNSQNDSSVTKQIQSVFDDKTLMDNVLSSWMENRYLKDQDNEIDMVCKYMPRLVEALDTKKDNVLSSDHFSKDFLNIYKNDTIFADESLKQKIEGIKDKYDLAELIGTAYEKASKYGEQFLYIVDYKKALAKLQATKGGTIDARTQLEKGLIVESGPVSTPYKMDNLDSIRDMDNLSKYNIELELNMSNMIDSHVKKMYEIQNIRRKISENSVAMIDETKIDKELLGSLDYSDFEKSTAKDGLIVNKGDKTEAEYEKRINVPGCIVKKIDRSHIIPIYIEDTCLGYYYFEFKDNDEFSAGGLGLTNSIMSNKVSKDQTSNNGFDQRYDKMLKFVSGELSKFIDSKFINQNQDLTKEIYMILKHNDLFNTPSSERMKVTFLPPEDVIHIYFNKDSKTNRGISDLANSLLPAKFYSSMWVTNCIAYMTRGQDKRVYYVKQNVETNISKVLLNTIEQIKKSNFGIRQVENMNNILNIVGRFNDYIIPVGPSGDSPVQFEVMQGQQVEVKTELMNMLEEMAINCTDVPLELIQARQSIDYAVQLTMTNSKFLRKIYNRQAKFQRFVSDIITKIYNSEYGENERLTIMLPPPMFLNVTNTNQIIANVNELVASIVNVEMADERDDDKKAVFTRELTRYYLGTYLDFSKIDQLKKKSEQLVALKTNNDEQQ